MGGNTCNQLVNSSHTCMTAINCNQLQSTLLGGNKSNIPTSWCKGQGTHKALWQLFGHPLFFALGTESFWPLARPTPTCICPHNRCRGHCQGKCTTSRVALWLPKPIGNTPCHQPGKPQSPRKGASPTTTHGHRVRHSQSQQARF